MNSMTSGLAFAGALLMVSPASAQPSAPQPPMTAVPDRPDPTSSNPWDSLPAMSVDRCTAELLGTATDPKTGAPANAAIDPKTGKPLCPTVKQPVTKDSSTSR